jgi:hypothetical protein
MAKKGLVSKLSKLVKGLSIGKSKKSSRVKSLFVPKMSSRYSTKKRIRPY